MVRLADVADLAQVSVPTVSKIVNHAKGWDLYSEACVRRVRGAARQLGYRPNYHARSLQTGLAHALGLVTLPPEADSDWGAFWARVIGGADAEALAAGNHFVIIGPAGTESAIDRALGFCQEQRIDALIAPSFVHAVHPEAFEETRAPVVLMGPTGATEVPAVDLDDASGIAAAMAHVVGFGHHRVVWLGPDNSENPAAKRRQNAFAKSAAKHGCEAGAIVAACPLEGWPPSPERRVLWAKESFLAGWHSGRTGTAVICYDEAMAFGVYAGIAELGLQIPGDVSVVGFDDIHACMAYPAMTVVSHMLRDIGRRAARLALEMVGDPERWQQLRGHRERVAAQLVIRQSTGPRPENGRHT